MGLPRLFHVVSRDHDRDAVIHRKIKQMIPNAESKRILFFKMEDNQIRNNQKDNYLNLYPKQFKAKQNNLLSKGQLIEIE